MGAEGEPALVDSTSPRWGQQASYSSAVGVETGEVEWMELDGNRTAETSVAILRQLRAAHAVLVIVGPAHGGKPLRDYRTTPDPRLRLVRLPASSPDRGPDEKVWGWVREEATANTCFGTTATVREAVGACFRTLPGRAEEVKRRRRIILQSEADTLAPVATAIL